MRLILSRALGIEIVIIHVGPNKKPFAVHKKLLCARSEYFDKAFNSGFKEAQDGVIHLVEEDPEMFDLLINYFYHDSLPAFPSEEFSDDQDGCDEYVDYLWTLFYVAEKFCIDELANRIMDGIQDIQDHFGVIPSASSIKRIYKFTHESSRSRVYTVLTQFMHLANIEEDPGDFNLSNEVANIAKMVKEVPEFGADWVTLQSKYHTRFWGMKESDIADPQKRDETGFGQCFFHFHRNGQPCHLG